MAIDFNTDKLFIAKVVSKNGRTEKYCFLDLFGEIKLFKEEERFILFLADCCYSRLEDLTGDYEGIIEEILFSQYCLEITKRFTEDEVDFIKEAARRINS